MNKEIQKIEEKTYEEDDPSKVKTDMHDILGPKEKLFLQGAVGNDNGGWTYTLALDGAGAATDTGTGSASDQRAYDVNGIADIGAYEFRDSGWSLWGGGPGAMSGGLGSSKVRSRGSPIDVRKQLEFAKRWREWKEKGYVQVTVVDKE